MLLAIAYSTHLLSAPTLISVTSSDQIHIPRALDTNVEQVRHSFVTRGVGGNLMNSLCLDSAALNIEDQVTIRLPFTSGVFFRLLLPLSHGPRHLPSVVSYIIWLALYLP